jgi:hypothetical protein
MNNANLASNLLCYNDYNIDIPFTEANREALFEEVATNVANFWGFFFRGNLTEECKSQYDVREQCSSSSQELYEEFVSRVKHRVIYDLTEKNYTKFSTNGKPESKLLKILNSINYASNPFPNKCVVSIYIPDEDVISVHHKIANSIRFNSHAS